jgi:hypothetical protein
MEAKSKKAARHHCHAADCLIELVATLTRQYLRRAWGGRYLGKLLDRAVLHQLGLGVRLFILRLNLHFLHKNPSFQNRLKKSRRRTPEK